MTDAVSATSPTPKHKISFADLPSLAGQDLGASRTLRITQEQIDTFADATQDHQWIHVDPERAKNGPFGTTIAHGYLTLSLAVPLFWDILDVDGAAQVINYGLNKVRFPAPVPVDSEVGASAHVKSVDEVAGGYQLTVVLTFNVVGGERPVCISEMILRYLSPAE